MAPHPLLIFPDPRLRLPAAPVTRFDASTRQLAEDLRDTLRAAPGVGITAPHIGIALRLVVLELEPGTVEVFANPSLTPLGAGRQRQMEGSVSMPGVTEEVERFAQIEVRYQDLEGRPQSEIADGFRAVCHQHEADQLDGVFWIQRLSRLKRERVVRRFEKLRTPSLSKR